MSTLLKKFMLLLLLLSTVLVTVRAQGGGTCTTMPAPAWVDVTNITPTSALASWQNVGAGAWYRVELKNLNTGIIEDLTYTQLTYKVYTVLKPSTDYQVSVAASSCYIGPYGATSFKKFTTPSIIVEDVCGLEYRQQFNQQSQYDPANTERSGPAFQLCILKVANQDNIDKLNEVFHAYILMPNNIDFYEFTLVGLPSNQVAFPLSALGGPAAGDWATFFTDFNGIEHPIPQQGMAEGLIIHVEYKGDEVLTISGADMNGSGSYLPLWVWIGQGVRFFASDNDSGPCPGGSGTSRPETGNPIHVAAHSAPKGRVSPNPFTNHLDLHLSDFGKEITLVRILDGMGRVQFEATGAAAASEISGIETAGWQPGVYYLQVQTETGVQVVPVVKH